VLRDTERAESGIQLRMHKISRVIDLEDGSKVVAKLRDWLEIDIDINLDPTLPSINAKDKPSRVTCKGMMQSKKKNDPAFPL